MAVFNNILAGSSGQAVGGGGAYEISRSLRFNSDDTAYLSKDFASAGNRKKWTWAGWMKRSNLDANNYFFGYRPTSTPYGLLSFQSGGQIALEDSVAGSRVTVALFRDPSAWYHVVIVFDSDNATDEDRFIVYVNGTRQSLAGSTLTSGVNSSINATGIHNIGQQGGGFGGYFNGYLADVHFIDGQALDPTSFTEVDATTGQLVPIAYTGSYGTNGFHLPFSDNSTAAALGTDTSGNSNTWTVNNISVAAGAGNDSLVDTPTNYGEDTGAGGEVRGNYATWNPLALGAAGSITNGNLDLVITPPSTAEGRIGSLYFPSGKWYWEMTVTVVSSEYPHVGLTPRNDLVGINIDSNGDGYCIRMSGKIDALASLNQTYGASYASNDVVMFAFDVDAGKLWYGKNGTWQASGNPATGINPSSSGISTTIPYTFAASGFGSPAAILNAGQRPFAYTAPSGFKALCTTNLPEPDPNITPPSKVMDVALYTGNGSTQTVSGLGFSPDLVWIKNRTDNSTEHVLQDALRGFTTGAKLSSSSTEDEGDTTVLNDSFGYVDSATSDGFTLTKSGTGAADYSQTNQSTKAYVAWTWDAGSSTVTNTDGSITSQVRANPSAGFSVVTYTVGSNTAQTIGHGLGVAPQMIIVKERNQANNWQVYHSATGNTNYLYLNLTNQSTANNLWDNTSPTSTVFSIRSGGSSNFYDGKDHVAYCFAPVAGYSAFGSYTGNGSADGPFVYTGFRARFLLYKRTDVANDWYIMDTARDTYNVSGTRLFPNLSNAEFTYTSTDLIDVTANGFKIRSSNNAINASGGTYIYAAFAESPFQYARAR